MEAADEWSGRLFEHFFAEWHLSPAPADALPDVTISVRADSLPPRPPDSLEMFEMKFGGRCYTDEQTYLQETRGSVIYSRTGPTPRVEVWVGDSPAARRTRALARLVFDAVGAARRRCGLFELHGGGAIEPLSGAGALFAGPSGSGKSTLTVQLAARGWRYVSDDSLLLSERDGVIEARGVRRAFSVTESTIAASGVEGLKEVATRPVPFDPSKHHFHPQDIFPAGFAEACVPRVLFFTALTHEPESRCRPLTQFEAMSRLLKMCPWAAYDRPVAREHLRTLGGLARQCVSYDLHAGRNLLGDPGHTARFIADYVSAGSL